MGIPKLRKKQSSPSLDKSRLRKKSGGSKGSGSRATSIGISTLDKSTADQASPGKPSRKRLKQSQSSRAEARKLKSPEAERPSKVERSSNGLPYRFGPSPINGMGVFATRAIRKGEKIGEYLGPEATRNGKFVLWVEDGDEVYARSGRNGLRYLNHSRKPNAEFDEFVLFSIKNIDVGVEITFDYGDRELSFY